MKWRKRLVVWALALAGCDNPTQPSADPTVLEGDYAIRSQRDLELLAVAGGGSFRIVSDLSVDGSDLVALVGLEKLTRIGGDLSIRGSGVLTDLSARVFADRLVADGFTGTVTISDNQQERLRVQVLGAHHPGCTSLHLLTPRDYCSESSLRE